MPGARGGRPRSPSRRSIWQGILASSPNTSSRVPMATIIAIANQKGGVAKTTSTFNLAHALVEHRQRVLCVDADPQASLTSYFGFDPVDLGEKQKTLYFGL